MQSSQIGPLLLHPWLRHCWIGVLILVSVESSADTVGTISKPTTSRAAREDAIRGIPFRKLSTGAQRRIAAVVRRPTMFRRMPIAAIQCDPELHRFCVRHPEVIVNIWQLMGITKVAASRTGPYVLRCSDGVGTVTNMELIYGDNDTHVLLCEGSYDGPLFRRPLIGRCVLVLKSGARQAGASYRVTNMLDVFLQVDHAGVDIFAKTLHPLLGRSADVNFIESMRFLEWMSVVSETNSQGMYSIAERLQDVQPDVRESFKQVVANVDRRHRLLAKHAPAATTMTSAIDLPRNPDLPIRSGRSMTIRKH